MPYVDLKDVASSLSKAWTSRIVGAIGTTSIRVLRMNGHAVAEEVHVYDEALLVLHGTMLLRVGESVQCITDGQMHIVPAGVPHSVLEGSQGTLLILDEQAP